VCTHTCVRVVERACGFGLVDSVVERACEFGLVDGDDDDCFYYFQK